MNNKRLEEAYNGIFKTKELQRFKWRIDFKKY